MSDFERELIEIGSQEEASLPLDQVDEIFGGSEGSDTDTLMS